MNWKDVRYVCLFAIVIAGTAWFLVCAGFWFWDVEQTRRHAMRNQTTLCWKTVTTFNQQPFFADGERVYPIVFAPCQPGPHIDVKEIP